ncbi:MAG TPA: LuxR C-terminal-related transcriptional regulator [Acidimicrobiales bacterium]|nr:LuxR C-terminal-related transcriptional regulator [Acidimicrobiales bacterium]
MEESELGQFVGKAVADLAAAPALYAREALKPDGAVLLALWAYLTSGITRLVAQDQGQGTLTPRETDVLGLVTQGLTNYQIARRLAVSPRTIDKHLEHILAKLDVPCRAAAAARYVDMRRDGGSVSRGNRHMYMVL